MDTGLIKEKDIFQDENENYCIRLEYDSKDGDAPPHVKFHDGYDSLELTSKNAEWLIATVEGYILLDRLFPPLEDQVRRVVWNTTKREYLD